MSFVVKYLLIKRFPYGFSIFDFSTNPKNRNFRMFSQIALFRLTRKIEISDCKWKFRFFDQPEKMKFSPISEISDFSTKSKNRNFANSTQSMCNTGVIHWGDRCCAYLRRFSHTERHCQSKTSSSCCPCHLGATTTFASWNATPSLLRFHFLVFRIVSFEWKTILIHVVFLSGRIFAYNFSYVEIVLFFTQWYLIWLDSTYAFFLPCFCVFLFTLLLYLARLTFTLYVFWSWLTLSLFVFHQQGMSFPLTIRHHQQLDHDFLSFQGKTRLQFPLVPIKVCHLFPFSVSCFS